MLKAANSFHGLSLSVLLSFFTTVAVCAPKSAYPNTTEAPPTKTSDTKAARRKSPVA